MTNEDYWAECVSTAADEVGLVLTPEQLAHIANAVVGAHENYGMAFYRPPPSDRLAAVEREWKQKYERLQAELEKYRHDAEVAVKQALRQPHDANISIGEYGEVFRHGGRTTQIQ